MRWRSRSLAAARCKGRPSCQGQLVCRAGIVWSQSGSVMAYRSSAALSRAAANAASASPSANWSGSRPSKAFWCWRIHLQASSLSAVRLRESPLKISPSDSASSDHTESPGEDRTCQSGMASTLLTASTSLRKWGLSGSRATRWAIPREDSCQDI